MLYLLDMAIETAKNYANDSDSEHELAAAVEMGVIEVVDDKGNTTGRAINVFLPTRDTDADPAICQIVISEEGDVISDTPWNEEMDAQLLQDQIADAKERIAFCKETLAAIGYKKA